MNRIPTGKMERALTGGYTAAKAGGSMLGYYAKRPFLSETARMREKTDALRTGAQALFSGMSLLKGTALKMAQQLSLEMDVLPEEVCRELGKAYHQVPPINRALVRKLIQSGLGKPPEELFSEFDLNAFAAASIGQVHRAVSRGGDVLAVKIQYPGIADTIGSDLTLIRRLFTPVIQSEHLLPTLTEVEERLREEVDYLKEAGNLAFFAEHLRMDGVRIPAVREDLTTDSVLTTTMMPGKTLDEWLAGNPDREKREIVANRLNDILVKGLYELRVIHADPNPGNFIVDDDLTIGLVDFGCVKQLPVPFVEHYRRLVQSAAHHDREAHFQAMLDIGMLPDDLQGDALDAIWSVSDAVGEWFGALFENETFDFNVQTNFIAKGKAVMHRYKRLRRYVNVNPDFIFLERTRYGLLRLYERMGVRIRFRNIHEW